MITPITARGSDEASTTPADSMATSVPAPMAMPTSARARAGASLTPSPTMATLRPRAWRAATAASLSSGRTSAMTSSMPSRAPTASATGRASPVIMTTRTPRRWSSSTASWDSGRISSSRARAPAMRPSRTTWSTAAPRADHSASRSASSAGGSRPRWRSRAGPPTATRHAVDGGLHAPAGDGPEPGGPQVAASRGGGHDGPGQRVLGVGLDGAGQGQHRRLVDTRRPAATPVTTWAPLVRVPVLSNSTASMVRMRSRARRSLTRMPARAEIDVDRLTTSGMARPRAWGQAMTSTVTVRRKAWSVSPRAAQRRRWRRPARTAT